MSYFKGGFPPIKYCDNIEITIEGKKVVKKERLYQSNIKPKINMLKELIKENHTMKPIINLNDDNDELEITDL